MKRIKILVDAHIIGGEGQGSVTYLGGLYNSLLTTYDPYYDIYIAGYDLKEVQLVFPSLKKSQFIQLKSNSRLKRLIIDFPYLIKKHQIDVAHFQYITPFFKSTKFAVTTHDVLFNDFPKSFSWSYRFLRNFLFKYSLKQSEIRCTVSNYSQQAIANHYNFQKNSIKVTANAVAPCFFEPYDKALAQKIALKKFKVKKYLLYVSRIEPRKNHHLLIKIFKELQLAEAGYSLVFIGHESIPNFTLNQEIASLSKTEKANFKWFKNIPQTDLLNLYRGAELFVYPSLAEGFGIPPIEAIAAKIPTVCANNTAMRDFDFLGNNLVNIDNYHAFKTSIKTNLMNPISENHLMQMASEVARRYSWEVSAAVFHDTLQDQFGQRKMYHIDVKAA